MVIGLLALLRVRAALRVRVLAREPVQARARVLLQLPAQSRVGAAVVAGRASFKSFASFAAFVVAACAIGASGSVFASVSEGSLASVGSTSLPALPENGPLIGLVAVEGRPVAIQATSTWVLDADRKGWTKVPWPASSLTTALIRATAGDGRQAFILARDENLGAATGGASPDMRSTPGAQATPVTRVARLTVEGNSLGLRELPALPVPLTHALLTPYNAAIYVAGIDPAGKPQFLELSAATREQWVARAGWPGEGAPTTLVAQNSGVYLTIEDAGTARDEGAVEQVGAVHDDGQTALRASGVLACSAGRSTKAGSPRPARQARSYRHPAAPSARRTSCISCARPPSRPPPRSTPYSPITRSPMPGRSSLIPRALVRRLH